MLLFRVILDLFDLFYFNDEDRLCLDSIVERIRTFATLKNYEIWFNSFSFINMNDFLRRESELMVLFFRIHATYHFIKNIVDE